jgi:hypothetical protein
LAFEPKSQAPASKGKKTQGSKKTTTTTKPEDDKTKGSTVAPASVPSSSGGVPPTLKYPTDEETAARKAAAEAAMREDPSVFDEGDDLEAEIDAGLRELAKTDLALGPTCADRGELKLGRDGRRRDTRLSLDISEIRLDEPRCAKDKHRRHRPDDTERFGHPDLIRRLRLCAALQAAR